MDKKKIGIISIVIVSLVSIALVFNGIFLNAKKTENDNKTIVSSNKENNNKEDNVDNEEQEDKENKIDEQKKTDEEKTNQVNTESTTIENNKETNSNKSTNDMDNSQDSSTLKPNTDNNSNTNSSTIEVKPSQSTTQETPKAETVSISINCKTAINNGLNNQDGFTHLPSSGIILSNINVEIEDGDTVFDVLVKATRQKGIHMEYTGSGSSIYIEGINNLYEFDAGAESGWKYSVNSVYPNYGCGSYKVKANDVIKFSYTCNLGKDLGAR